MMKTQLCKTISYLFLVTFFSLNSCKKEDKNVDPSNSIVRFKPQIFRSVKFVGIKYVDSSAQESLTGISEVLPNNRFKISQIIYSAQKLNTLYNIEINDEYLIKSILVVTPESSRLLKLGSFRVNERKISLEVIDVLKNNTLIKYDATLSDNEVNQFKSIQSTGKALAGARIANSDCSELSSALKSFFEAATCLTYTIITPIVQGKCQYIDAALPTTLYQQLTPCERLPEAEQIKQNVCFLKNYYYEEFENCNPTKPNPTLEENFLCLQNAVRPPKTYEETQKELNKCFEEFQKKTQEEEKKKPNAHGTGDPHLLTFDGASYDFQGHGEFISTKSTTDNFEIQVRQEDVYKTGYVTMNTAIAVQTGTDIVCVTVKPYKLFINKQIQDLASLNTLLLKDGANITKTKQNNLDALNITNKNGDIVKVVFHSSDYLDYFIYLSDNRKNKVTGLMGNYDGDKTNDVLTQTGENILTNGSLPFNKLYPTYSDSWRITNANSLFYYDSNKNTDTYTQKDFPRTLQTITTAQKASAESVCRSAGVSLEPFLSNCIYDVAITNNSALANSALVAQTNANSNNTPPIAIIPPSNQATIIDFNDIKQIELKGKANVLNNCIRLTDASYNVVGAAYYKSSVKGDFESEFTFKISEIGGSGADGFAFIISKDIPVLGGAEGIGYQGTKSSLAVEFDTYQNSNLGDPNDNHISIHTNGQDTNSANEKFSIGINDKIINLSDGKEHTVKVIYQNNNMEIFLDGKSTVKASIDLNSKLGLNGSFYIGFTAATGGASEIHDICSWSIRNL